MNKARRFLPFLLLLFSCFVLLQALDKPHSSHEQATPAHWEDKAAALDKLMVRRLAGGGSSGGGGGRGGGGSGGSGGRSSGGRSSDDGGDSGGDGGGSSGGNVDRGNAKLSVAATALGLLFLVASLLST